MPSKYVSSDGERREARRVGRVLKIIGQIAADPGRWSRGDLAEYYGVSERMITKDLHLIRTAIGLPLSYHPEGGGYYFVTEPPAALLAISRAAGGKEIS